MKKTLYALAVALTCGLAANAAPQVSALRANNQSVSIDKVEAQLKADKNVAVPVGRKAKAVKNRVATAEDFIGSWQWRGQSPLSSEYLPSSGIMTISQDTQTDSLLVQGFEYFSTGLEKNGLRAYVKDGRLYIPNQLSHVEDDPLYTLWFINFTLRNAKPGEDPEYKYYTYSPIDFYFTFNEDGTLSSGSPITSEDPTDQELAENLCIATDLFVNRDNKEGEGFYFYWAVRYVTATPLEIFAFNADEWAYAGVAVFQDAWFAELFNVNIPAYDVDLYRSKLNENRFLLFDPYGPSTPYGEYGINESPDEGFLVFDMTDPDCVLFEPLVYSITMDTGDEEESDLQKFYCYNAEGYYYYLQDATTEEIISNFDMNEKACSFFDPSDRYLGIYNGLFDMIPEGTLGAGYSWTGASMEGYVILPEGYNDDSSVKDIIGADNNAPAEYFNLQGVRVNNPEKGQLVIVRQGSKASKQVVR